jgi:hypothetical protein
MNSTKATPKNSLLRRSTALLVVLCCSLFSCAHGKVYKYSDFSKPYIFVRQVGGDLNDRTGPVAVLWEDGRLLLPANNNSVGSSYILSSVDSESVKLVQQLVDESGVWKSKEGGLVIADSRTMVVQINHNGMNKSWLHSFPLPPESFLGRLTTLLESLPSRTPTKIRWKEEYPKSWKK